MFIFVPVINFAKLLRTIRVRPCKACQVTLCIKIPATGRKRKTPSSYVVSSTQHPPFYSLSSRSLVCKL